MSEVEAQELLEELDLGGASQAYRQGQTREMEIEVVRPLTEDDLPLLLAPPPARVSVPALKDVKFVHHQMARLLVQGRRVEEISAITGYSPGWISGMQGDPAFQDLLVYYSTNTDLVHVDVLERMRALHIASIEELQKRLDEEPEGWSKRELMELADQMGKPLITAIGAKGGQGQGGGGGVNIGITFVQPPKPGSPVGASGMLIDQEGAIDVTSRDE